MTRYFTMHADNPQPRLIKQAAEALKEGQLIAYPTDSSYALGCALNSKKAVETLRRIRGLEPNHPLTLLCSSISQASEYCLLNDQAYKIFKKYTPGPYTFIVPATKLVPRPAMGLKRKVVGIRIPAYPLVLALVAALEEPILSTTLWLPGDEQPLADPQEIDRRTQGEVSLILDAGEPTNLPTTLIDLIGPTPKILRRGQGDPLPFE